MENSSEHTSEGNDIKRAVCSVAQDICFGVSNHKKLTPKHIWLGLVLHQVPRSENLVQLFNAANHTIGIDTVPRFDNAIANNVLDRFVANGYVFIPDNIEPSRFIQFSCDNIDVLEATPEGKNTFHCIQMMAWQRRSENQVLQNLPRKDERQRKLDHHVLTRFHEHDKAKMSAYSRPGPNF